MLTQAHGPAGALSAMALALVLAACSSEQQQGTEPGPTSGPQDPGSGQTPAGPGGTAEPPGGGGGSGSGTDWATVDLGTIDWATIDLKTVDFVAIQDNPTAVNMSDADRQLIASRLFYGSATFTLGGASYEAESFLCASGHDNTQSDAYAFTSNGTFVIDGTQVSVQFGVRDPSGTGQTSGGDVAYELDATDTNFSAPSFDWAMVDVASASIDGYSVVVSGSFDDKLTEGTEESVAGSLTAECGDQSRF